MESDDEQTQIKAFQANQTSVSKRNNGKTNDSKMTTASELAKMKDYKAFDASDILEEEDFKGQEGMKKPALVETYYTLVQKKQKGKKKSDEKQGDKNHK